MSIAIYVKSENPSTPGMTREVIMAPGNTPGDVPTLFWRIDGSTGKRPWKKDTLKNALQIVPTGEQTSHVSAVPLTEEFVRTLVAGSMPAAMLSALRSSVSAVNHVNLGTLRNDLSNLHERLMEADDTLAGLTGSAFPIVNHLNLDPASMPRVSAPTPPPVSTVKSAAKSDESSWRSVSEPLPLLKVDRVARVPDPSVGKKYRHRMLSPRTSDFDVLDVALRDGKPVLLIGDTGSGKTHLPMAYAAENKLPCAVVSCNVAVEPSSFFGKVVPIDSDGQLGFLPGPVTDVALYGGVLVLDEINFAPPRVLPALYHLLSGHAEFSLSEARGQVFKRHPDMLIVATMNEGYVGTSELNEALRSRFLLQFPWGYDTNVEKQLGVKAAVAAFAAQLRSGTDIEGPTPTPRLLALQHHISEFGWDIAAMIFATSYPVDDRDSVKTLLSTHKANILAAIK